jgi:hypothetical protein
MTVGTLSFRALRQSLAFSERWSVVSDWAIFLSCSLPSIGVRRIESGWASRM